MQFSEYTTSSLLKSKQDFEYAAQMCALERVGIPDLAAEEYLLIKQEIQRRESMYAKSCTSAGFVAALEDLLTAISERTLSGLIDKLAQGVESREQSAEVKVNPKSEFFREILLRRELDAQDDTIKAAIFFPGGALHVDWLLDACPDLAVSGATGAGEPLIYEVLRTAGEQSGCIEFVSSSLTYDPNALVTMIRVACL